MAELIRQNQPATKIPPGDCLGCDVTRGNRVKPQKPLPTYPTTQPATQPVPISPTSQPAARAASTGPGSRRRPPLTDLGTPGIISTVFEYLLYIAAVALLVIAGMGVATGLKGLADSANEPDKIGAGLELWGARAHFTWSLFEACLALFLAAVGMVLNHLRYAAAVLKSLYLNPQAERTPQAPSRYEDNFPGAQ